MGGWLSVVQAASPRGELRHFEELIGSWPVQLVMAVVLLWLPRSTKLSHLGAAAAEEGSGAAVVVVLGAVR